MPTALDKQPRVSVIIPVFNSIDCLGRAADSVLQQSLRELELILVDDGSTDGSEKLCDAYAERDGRVHVIHQANAGVSAATNRGLDAARGEYVAFVDHDDYISRQFCAVLYANGAQVHADISKGTMVRTNRDGTHELNVWMNKAIHKHRSPLFFFGEWWTAIYRRDFLNQYHLRLREDLILAHDLLFQNEAVLRCSLLTTCEWAHYFWCYREGSTDMGTQQRSPQKIRSALQAYTAITDNVRRCQQALAPDAIANVYFQCIHRLAGNAARAERPEDAEACKQLAGTLFSSCPPQSRAEVQRLMLKFQHRAVPARPDGQ